MTAASDPKMKKSYHSKTVPAQDAATTSVMFPPAEPTGRAPTSTADIRVLLPGHSLCAPALMVRSAYAEASADKTKHTTRRSLSAGGQAHHEARVRYHRLRVLGDEEGNGTWAQGRARHERTRTLHQCRNPCRRYHPDGRTQHRARPAAGARQGEPYRRRALRPRGAGPDDKPHHHHR